MSIVFYYKLSYVLALPIYLNYKILMFLKCFHFKYYNKNGSGAKVEVA